MERVVTRLDISLMQKGNTRGVGNLKQVVLIFILQEKISFMLFTLGMSKRVLPMLLPACYKSSLLMFIFLDPGFTLSFINPLVS